MLERPPMRGTRSMEGRLPLSYVLPLKAAQSFHYPDLTAELAALAGLVSEVIVVDGSYPDVFAAHAAAWSETVSHLRPEVRCASGKAAGVLTGLRHATCEVVVLADDDVRWDEAGLRAALALAADADVVVPQNHFAPAPWHARWDTARTLVARALGGDFPGTLVVRRAPLAAAGGYDGNCLFENLELMRTVEAIGGRVRRAPGLYVRRLPPTSRHFYSQRVRQAYDEFARPAVLVTELLVLPVVAVLVARRRYRALALGAGAVVTLAEVGRRRAGGARVFPRDAALFAPLWLAERAVCSWVAVAQRLLAGGTPYAGGVLRKAANPPRVLRRRFQASV